ncbi:MAG: amidohydrolase [Planctomycetes bacterium]|nr:amidohydrolase [Planctomycetota bacterium]
MKLELTANEAMKRIDLILSHAWMVRAFLKHAPEIERDADLMTIPRAIFDYARALEAARTQSDTGRYLRLARNKLHRLKAAAERLEEELGKISDHTNFKQAAASLSGCVRQIEEVLASLPRADSGPELGSESVAAPSPASRVESEDEPEETGL